MFRLTCLSYSVAHQSCLTHTFASEKNQTPLPPSLPTPLSFTPPKGTRRSLCSHVLTQTMPEWIFSATLLPFSKSSVQMLPAKPYLRIICNFYGLMLELNLCTVTKGPKTSSVEHLVSVPRPVITVGDIQLPPSNSFGKHGSPPVTICPPSCRASDT